MSFLGGLFGGNSGLNYSASAPGYTPAGTTTEINPLTGQPVTVATPASGTPGTTAIQNPFNAASVNTQQQASQGITAQQQAFLNALASQQGIQNQNQALTNLQGIQGQVQGVANGTGPNPALALLSQSTGQNIAAQGALMAGQRGAAANPALLARQAAQQGAAIQQQAIGQGAGLQAQQQLGALGQLGGLGSQIAGVSTQQVGQQQAAQQALANQQLQQQALTQQQLQSQNQANVSAMGNINSANAGIAQQAAGQQGNLIGGITGGIGSALGALFAEGGAVPNEQAILKENYKDDGKPRSKVGQYMYASGGSVKTPGKVPAIVSPGEIYLNKQAVAKVKDGKNPVDVGERIPGKAKVKGDSYSNDVVPRTLESGGIVIPRSKALGGEQREKAQRFAKAVISKKKK